MKVATMLLFGAYIISSFLWIKAERKCEKLEVEKFELKSQIHIRDSVNLENKKVVKITLQWEDSASWSSEIKHLIKKFK